MTASTGSGRAHAAVAAGVALILLAMACEKRIAVDNAGITHANGTRISPDRPECPQVWDSIPLFENRKEPNVPEDGRREAGSGGSGGGGASTAAGWVDARALGAAGPITNIPEFHDCQMFITADGRSYDGLYAIFASFQLDSVVKDLKIDALLWVSSNPVVATVTASGRVTAVSLGNATITGTSTADATRSAAFVLDVLPGLPVPDSTVLVGPGLPAPPPMAVGQSVTFAMTLAPPTKSAFPVGEVYAYSDGYTPLGIGANFSCLYIYFDTGGVLRATMVQVTNLGSAPNACATKVDPNLQGGKQLQIVRRLVANDADVPPAARWDFDTKHKKQYIGIKCGSAWCEIGDSSFVSSGGYVAAPGATPGEAKVIGNKGWYDQQYLAMYDATAGRLVPTRIKGTVIPYPEPTPRALAAYRDRFIPIAYVALDVSQADAQSVRSYRDKYGFRPAPVSDFSKMNRLELCLGTASGCGIVNPPTSATCAATTLDAFSPGARWWVRLTPAEGGDPMYRCVTRRLHPNLDKSLWPPVTARWRWLALDETVWRECVAGCCEVEVGPGSPGW